KTFGSLPALSIAVNDAGTSHGFSKMLLTVMFGFCFSNSATSSSRGVPTVLMNAAIDNLDFPRVSTDDVTAAGQAYTHLASLGHQRIGLVLGPEDHVPSRRKLAGFAAHARRAPENAPVEHALFSLEGGQAATTRLLRHGVTGVICAS